MDGTPCIPESEKTLIRAVLLSKRGIPLNQFMKDFCLLEGRHLPFKKYGFNTMRDALESIPDTARFEFSDKVNAWIVYGIAKPDMFMSSFARIKQFTNENAGLPEKRRRRTKSKETMDDRVKTDQGDLVLSNRGLYSIVVKCHQQLITLEEITPLLQDYGTITEKHCLALSDINILFYRYKRKEDALHVLEKMKGASYNGIRLTVKPAEERMRATQENKNKDERPRRMRGKPKGSKSGSESTDRSESTDVSDYGGRLDSTNQFNSDDDAYDDDSPPPLVDDSSDDDEEPPPLEDDSSEETDPIDQSISNLKIHPSINGHDTPPSLSDSSLSSHRSAFHRYSGKT